jgi:hypothetical protein
MPGTAAFSSRGCTGWNGTARAILIAFLGLAIPWSFGTTIANPTCQDQDFGAYYRAALAVRHGGTPYTVDKHGPMGVYPYAPAFAYCLIPLTYLDYQWACRCWMLLNWLATAAGFLLAVGLLQPEHEEVWGIVLVALVPVEAYLWTNLHVGQASMIMVLGCLSWGYCQRQNHRFLGGLFLAASSALKLAPLALVPYLVHQRDRRGGAGLMAGLAMLFALPAAWVGWRGTCDLHIAWFNHTATTQVPVQTYRPVNQSLLAQLARLPPFSNGHECYSAERLSQLTHAYPLLLAGVAVLLYAWIFLDGRRDNKTNGCFDDRCTILPSRRPDASAPGRLSCDSLHLALLLVFLTLSNPRAWRCNFVALLFPCLMLAKQVWRQEPGYRMGLAALGITLLACVLPTHGLSERGWNLGSWLLEGKHFWAGIAVGGACWWCSRGAPVELFRNLSRDCQPLQMCPSRPLRGV